MSYIAVAGAGVGLIGGVGQMFGRGKANRQLDAIKAQNDALANNRLGLAKTLFNARMPGAATVEKNIFSNQANTVGNIEKTATSSNEALLGGAAAGGQTNDALNKLGLNEADYKQTQYSNLNDANNAKLAANEADADIQGAQQQNKQANWASISNLGFGLSSFGLQGGFKNMFKRNAAASAEVNQPTANYGSFFQGVNNGI